MKEFILITLNEVNISAPETHSKPPPLKNMDETLKVGSHEFKDHMANLLMDKKTDNHLKLILWNYILQELLSNQKINSEFLVSRR